MQQDDMALTFQTLEKDKNQLLKNVYDEDLLSFLIEWFLCSENQTQKQEQRYIWSLIHGWAISELAEKKTAEPMGSVDEVQICQNKEKFPFQSEKVSTSQVCLNFLSAKEVVIKESSTLFWINPSSIDKEILSLATSLQTFIVVLTTSHSSHLFHILDLIAIKIVFRVITLESIYNKIKILLNFLKKREPQRYTHLTLGKFYFLKANQYFEYGGFLWQPINCCWYQPQYDLLIAPNRAKHEIFLVESSKVTETKYIYYGWKKGFITEENYQRYTGSKPEGIITAKDQLFHQITKIEVPQLKQYEYLHFKKKQLIRDIDDQDQEEIWNCLEELTLTAGQVVVKKGTIFDHIFILFTGEFSVEYQGSQQNPANKALLYGLQDLRKDSSHNSFTLKCTRAGTVKRVEKENFRCIMYDYLF